MTPEELKKEQEQLDRGDEWCRIFDSLAPSAQDVVAWSTLFLSIVRGAKDNQLTDDQLRKILPAVVKHFRLSSILSFLELSGRMLEEHGYGQKLCADDFVTVNGRILADIHDKHVEEIGPLIDMIPGMAGPKPKHEPEVGK